MLPSLLLAATIAAPGAPIPKDTLPNPTGPAPKVLAVKANSAGSVLIIAMVFEKRKVQQQFFVVENGKQVLKQQEVETMTSTYIQKNMADFGGKFTTVSGSELSVEQANKRVKDGATILVTADGKPIDPSWLLSVSRDTVIMHTSELASAQFQYGHSLLPTTPNPRLVLLGADDKGNVRVPVNPNSANGVYYDEFGNFQNNVRVFRNNGRMVVMNGGIMPAEDGSAAPAVKPAGPDGKKALEDIQFDAFDMTGKLISRPEALKRLKAGGLVLFAGDNRFPDPDYLKAFNEDMIVLASNEFIFPPGTPNPYDAPLKSPLAPAAKPAIAPAAPALLPLVQPAPVVVQVQVAPAKLQPPAAAPEKELLPAPKEKKTETAAPKP